MKTLSKDQFISYLRSSLHNLYYPDQLRRSPLTELFGIDQHLNASSLLQRILTDAIAHLKPGQGEPPQSRSWRIYDVLVYRYIRQFDREVVANQLGISGRQFRREQRTALEALADALTREYSLETKIATMQADEIDDIDEIHEIGDETDVPDELKEPVPDELSWLKDTSNHGPTTLKPVMNAVLNLSRPLAERFAVQINCAQAENIPDLDIPALALRHILLTLLSVAIPQASGKSLNIFVTSSEKNVLVEIVPQGPLERANGMLEKGQKSLLIVQQLMELFSGTYTLVNDPGHFSIRLTFPSIEKIPVLLIDDNPDTILLIQRYVSNTRYIVVEVRDPNKAVHLAEVHSPKIILLDLMMPGVDGWEVLSQIRQNPLTNAIPVVVVSILPQESLALAMGASAFLQKPINQNDFLILLNQFFPEDNRS
jgi:CheY-like chemotaxis protein